MYHGGGAYGGAYGGQMGAAPLGTSYLPVPAPHGAYGAPPAHAGGYGTNSSPYPYAAQSTPYPAAVGAWPSPGVAPHGPTGASPWQHGPFKFTADAPGEHYSVGQSVECYRQSEGKWVPAQVIAVAPDGTVSVKYNNGQTKDIGRKYHSEFLRPSKRRADGQGHGHHKHGRHAPASSRYSPGQKVEAYSRTQGAWVPAYVEEVRPDGTALVKYTGANDGLYKDMNLSEQEAQLRPATAAVAEPRGSPTYHGHGHHDHRHKHGGGSSHHSSHHHHDHRSSHHHRDDESNMGVTRPAGPEPDGSTYPSAYSSASIPPTILPPGATGVPAESKAYSSGYNGSMSIRGGEIPPTAPGGISPASCKSGVSVYSNESRQLPPTVYG